MTVSVHLLRAVSLSALCTGSLFAQSPREGDRPAPLPVLQTIAFDVGAALQERWRVTLEPLVFGRITIGMSGGTTTTPDRAREWPEVMPLMYRTAFDLYAPCLPPNPALDYPGCGYYPYYQPMRPRYRASHISLNARWYPAGLSRDGERQRFGIYVGEFLSYHERRIRWPGSIQYYGSPLVDPLIYPDSVYPIPEPTPWIGPSWVRRVRGIEPGGELGARLMMGPRVIIDIGGSVRIVTLDDPLSRRRPGEADARFVLLVGVGW